MAKGKSDVFVNMAFCQCTESAANTLTFNEIQTGLSMFEKVAWVIHRILWFNNSIPLLIDDADSIIAALVVSNKITDLDLSDPATIDLVGYRLAKSGVAASGWMTHLPLEHDFSGLPGGGLIIPPRPLYVGLKGVSLATPSTIAMRAYFTHRDLAADEYWELVEARRMVE